MGADLAAKFAVVRAVFERADHVVGYELSVLCSAGPNEVLRRTRYAQPAIFTLSVACYELLVAQGILPSAVAGHSLGEWAALVAAGCLDFEDALRAVQRRAELLEEVGLKTPGVMTAVVGAAEGAVEEACRSARQKGIVELVIRNAPDQVVISGMKAAVEAAEKTLESQGVVCLRIDTPNAFHTPLVAAVAEGLQSFLVGVDFRPPRVPFCSNWKTEFLSHPEEIRRSMVAQVTGPIDWVAVSHKLIGAGYSPIVEVGPRNVLGGLFRRIDRAVTCLGTASVSQFEKALDRLGARTESAPAGAR